MSLTLEEMIHVALEANGWSHFYGNSWFRHGDSDRNAVSTEHAFARLLYQSNLISDNDLNDFTKPERKDEQ